MDRQTVDKPSMRDRLGRVFFIFPSVEHVVQSVGKDIITNDLLRLTGGKAEEGREAVRDTLEWEMDQTSRVQPNRVHLGVGECKLHWVHGLEKDHRLSIRLVLLRSMWSLSF